METKYIIDKDTVTVLKLDENLLKESLPPAVYLVEQSPSGYYLTKLGDKLDAPAREYGSITSRKHRIFNTFEQSNKSIGALFTGLKGSGKTALANSICNLAIDNNYPVVVIRNSFDNSIYQFLELLPPHVLLIDEFVKIMDSNVDNYERPSGANQEPLLHLLDGTVPGKRLTILTDNSIHEVNSYLIDRPSRILYSIKFKTLEPIVTSEILKEHKIKKSIRKQIIKYAGKQQMFSIDILKEIITEHKRYPKLSIEELFGIMNIPIADETYTCIIEEVTGPLASKLPLNTQLQLNDLQDPYEKSFSISVPIPEDDDTPDPDSTIAFRRDVRHYTFYKDSIITKDEHYIVAEHRNGSIIKVRYYVNNSVYYGR